jgi:hypothetical protein
VVPPQNRRWGGCPNTNGVAERAALLAHAEAICGIPVRREITPELRRALTLKPKAQDFI